VTRTLRPKPPSGENPPDAWVRPVFWGVLALSAALNSWALSINQWANTYYSATVLGMTRSWKAFFFGALDANSFITVDKPPLALWVQALSARIFGFNTWSLLLPQSIAAVLTVCVVYHVVRRGFGPFAASVAALALAVTPIAVVMARHNNPDTLLALLLALALWAASNAIRSGKLAPLVWCAVAVGLAFNTKMLQAYFVLPVIAIVYLVAGHLRWPRKLLNLAIATAVLAVASFWWMFAVDLTPAASRPYVGGSTNNTVTDLLLGYNGLGRIFGQDRIASPGMMSGMRGGPGGGPGFPVGGGGFPSPGGGFPGGGAGFGGGMDGGWTKLFTASVAPQFGWLLPLAALGAVAVVVHLWRRPRRDPVRADFLLWAGTLLVTVVVFSFASGIWHPYYTVALAAPLAAVAGMGLASMITLARSADWWSLLLPASIAATGIWAAHLLGTANYLPWLAPVVAVVAVLAAIAMAIPLLLPPQRRKPHTRLVIAAALAGVIAVMSGPTAYAVTPLWTPVAATFPLAGPAAGPTVARNFPTGRGPAAARNRLPRGGRPTTDGRGGVGGPGGFGAGEQLVPGAVRYLMAHHGNEKWLVAVVGAMVAAPVILDTGQPVMAVGGYNGNDPAPTVGQLQQYVHSGELRYVWTSGSSGIRSVRSSVGNNDAKVVDDSMGWVAAHCAVVPPAAYGGSSASTTQLYDCAGAR
jgi:4-amino-4-deoxy-L-arabinose transferase-like glycosyltransferase